MKNIFAILLLFIGINVIGQQNQPGILIPKPNSSVYENAISWYSGTIERNPTDVKTILLRAELYKTLNMTAEANADYDLAMSINPYSYLYMNKAERNKFFTRRNYSYYQIKDSAPAKSFIKSYLLADEYEKLITEHSISDKSKSLIELALVAINEGDYEIAEWKLSSVQESDQDHALYHDVMGVLFLEKGEIEMAIECFTKAIRKNNTFTIAFHNRAVAHKMNGDYEASKRDFNTALNQRADLAKIQFSKAKLLEMEGDINGAKYFYENAISANNDYTEARLNYTVLLKAAGEYTKALIEINNLIDQYPDDVNNYYVRGGLHFIYGEYSKAVDDFDIYLSNNPKDSDVLFYRGLCLVLDGNVNRGCEDINESIDNGYDDYSDLYLYMCE